MDTRTLGYLGGGLLLAIVVVTLVGVPPTVWIPAALIVGVVGTVGLWLLLRAQGDGAPHEGAASGVDARATTMSATASAAGPAPSSEVEVELVRPAVPAAGIPAVWLHRRGGRRVHRFRSDEGWVVRRVSTKDPDNPRLRVIGEPILCATEAEAVRAADELVQGPAPAATSSGRRGVATARA